MKNLILPLALSLASSMAFAAPPAHKMAPNAHGVARSTAVRSDVANENANGPRLVKHRRVARRMAQGRSARATVRAHSSVNY